MTTCLDPIWERYGTARTAFKVVSRCVRVPGIDRERAFGNTELRGIPDADVLARLAAAERDLNDGAVLSLHARFEARLQEHVAHHASRLSQATKPDSQFGAGLAALFEQQTEAFRMDAITGLFASAVGAATVDRVATIRTYRHWLAHGRSRTAPPTLGPRFTYTTLTTFLTAAGLS